MRVEGTEGVITGPGKGRDGFRDENKCKLHFVCWNVGGW